MLAGLCAACPTNGDAAPEKIAQAVQDYAQRATLTLLAKESIGVSLAAYAVEPVPERLRPKADRILQEAAKRASTSRLVVDDGQRYRVRVTAKRSTNPALQLLEVGPGAEPDAIKAPAVPFEAKRVAEFNEQQWRTAQGSPGSGNRYPFPLYLALHSEQREAAVAVVAAVVRPRFKDLLHDEPRVLAAISAGHPCLNVPGALAAVLMTSTTPSLSGDTKWVFSANRPGSFIALAEWRRRGKVRMSDRLPLWAWYRRTDNVSYPTASGGFQLLKDVQSLRNHCALWLYTCCASTGWQHKVAPLRLLNTLLQQTLLAAPDLLRQQFIPVHRGLNSAFVPVGHASEISRPLCELLQCSHPPQSLSYIMPDGSRTYTLAPSSTAVAAIVNGADRNGPSQFRTESDGFDLQGAAERSFVVGIYAFECTDALRIARTLCEQTACSGWVQPVVRDNHQLWQRLQWRALHKTPHEITGRLSIVIVFPELSSIPTALAGFLQSHLLSRAAGQKSLLAVVPPHPLASLLHCGKGDALELPFSNVVESDADACAFLKNAN
eukprot:TRINITY_DN1902_c0_g1_i1.p1 TRINITY_DN1902_c0_g1~~TRINITY_DN1902_c0_g1_i1.p1  ORF type:complete len:549 (+),score=66.83 TRINITY_DN1902_c0_g1_i1:2120-3766(+)